MALRRGSRDIELRVPTTLAAIDAGSNAIRLIIARAESPTKLRVLETERYALRLGHLVFTQHQFDRQTIDKAAKAFRHFRSLMDLHDVEHYRAVATSATRAALNQRSLIARVQEESGIRIEVIDASEEARLVRCAVHAVLAGKLSPKWIADLGGGSLEISRFHAGAVRESVALPAGTVRLLETFEIQDSITAQQSVLIRSYVLSYLRRYLPTVAQSRNSLTVACGGNAEALALIAPGIPRSGFRTLDLELLRRKLPHILALDVKRRMRTFRVRKDRAEVMGIAGIVLASLGQWLNQKQFLIPGVGVKEGILIDLMHSLSESRRAREDAERARDLLGSVRRYAARFAWNSAHAEKVREMAALLFRQLKPLHRMGPQAGLVLEVAALLHGMGNAVHHRLDYQHGEYLVRHGEIAGLGENRRNLVASIIRYSSELSPDADQDFFSTFSRKRQWQVCSLAAILRIADALDADHLQSVTNVRARLDGQKVHIGVRMKRRSELVLWAAARRATLLEGVFDRKTVFKQLPSR